MLRFKKLLIYKFDQMKNTVILSYKWYLNTKLYVSLKLPLMVAILCQIT